MCFQVAMYHRQNIAHHSQGHILIRLALVLCQRINVSIPAICGFHTPQNITGKLAKIRIHKRGRLQLQSVHIAPVQLFRGQRAFQEIPRNRGTFHHRSERRIMWRGGSGCVFIHNRLLELKVGR
ncbi:hypothetical protein BvCmsNSP039_04710 [Escherichia coli]|nr:hypothetical protein BvCmsNSP039_04710 [Escherichia coli]